MLKLFVWVDFEPDYTDGLAFAIAENEDDARKQIIDFDRKATGWTSLDLDYAEWGILEVHPLDAKVARCVGGGG